MINKYHSIELLLNGNKVDLESDASLNIRFQNTMFDPEKISSNTSEYSFSFNLPSTPVNDKIFDYANTLSKLNKYRNRYDAEVIADGISVFVGTLTLNSFKEKKYNCNLVAIKTYSLDEIFEDAVLTDIDNWNIDFSGVTTINSINAGSRDDVKFPFVSYGAFQKTPYNSDDVANDYTPKHDLDEWNNWYVESFYPSLNMLDTLKHCFEYKDYNVGGDAFSDQILKNIYMSTNLADEQAPEYNLGNPMFGKVQLKATLTSSASGYIQTLKYPYFRVGGYYDLIQSVDVQPQYNFSAVQLYDMLSQGTVSASTYQYMYQPYEHLIVIPSDGFYKIDLDVSGTVTTTGSLTAMQWVREWNDNTGTINSDPEQKSISFSADVRTTVPFEIQLVRNYDDNLELIKGKYNMIFQDGYPDHTTEGDKGIINNYIKPRTDFPHEKLGTYASSFYYNLTKMNELTGSSYTTLDCEVGYMHQDNEIMCFDPVVSDNFICGFSTMGNFDGAGTMSVIRNGYSWSKLSGEENSVFAPVIGYDKVNFNHSDWSFITTSSTYNSNTYINCPAATFTLNTATKTLTGHISCIVWLKKNDNLQLFLVNRDYTDSNGLTVNYTTNASATLSIEAFSNKNWQYLKDNHLNEYYTPTMFPEQLNLAQFLNQEKKISDFVQNIADAFNLEIIQNGKNVEINKKKHIGKFNNTKVINIDGRVNNDEAETSRINYPKSMAVKYKINTEEYGFESTVPSDKRDLKDWTKYGDSGYTIVNLNDDSYITTTSDKNLQFSYTWYDTFNWHEVDSGFTGSSSASTEISIPAISKEEYLAEGVDYDEAMKHDGYNLPQRFWFKPEATNMYVWTKTYPVEQVTLYKPVNALNGVNLSYKDTEESLLTKYFNITPYLSSNYVTVEVYITPEEYNLLKNGAYIRFDSDIYIPTELSGYDISGNNPTTIKMIKKVS